MKTGVMLNILASCIYLFKEHKWLCGIRMYATENIEYRLERELMNTVPTLKYLSTGFWPYFKYTPYMRHTVIIIIIKPAHNSQ